MKFATQMSNISHHTLPMLLHYLGKFKFKFAANKKEMQTKCIDF